MSSGEVGLMFTLVLVSTSWQLIYERVFLACIKQAYNQMPQKRGLN